MLVKACCFSAHAPCCGEDEGCKGGVFHLSQTVARRPVSSHAHASYSSHIFV